MNGPITNKDLYEIIDSRFNRVEKKLDLACERITTIEVWRGQVIGYTSAIAGVVGLVTAIFVGWIKDKIE